MPAKPSEEKAAKNTDREIWRKIPEGYYSPSIHVTKDGGIGINVGGFVHVRPIEEWHSMVAAIDADRILIKHWQGRFDKAEKRIEELEKQAKIKDSLVEGVMTLAEVYEQLEDAKVRITELEKRPMSRTVIEHLAELIGGFLSDEDGNECNLFDLPKWLYEELETNRDLLEEYLEKGVIHFENERITELWVENQRLRDALGMQKSLWEMIKDDLNALDRQKLQVPFMDLQDPIGAINKALRPQENKEDAKTENYWLKDRMIAAKQIIEKAHGKPNKDACCETCYILEQLDKWIEALHPREEEPCGE